MRKVYEEFYRKIKIVIYLGKYYYFYKLKFPKDEKLAYTEGYSYDFKNEAIEEARKYIDIVEDYKEE